jgi:transcriptional regulator with XRE-family HTH domain
MEERGWSQADLARALGVTKGVASRLVNIERSLGLDLFFLIHSKLGLDANKLLNDDPPSRFFNPSAGLAAELESIAKGLPVESAEKLRLAASKLRTAARRKRHPRVTDR